MQDRSIGPPVRVLLADDHTMFRESLAKVLAAYGGIEVVAETTSDKSTLALAREEKPDVVVMQVQLPFERAKVTLDKIRSISPAPKVVICTTFEDPRLVREFMKLGVSGYLDKSASVEQLVAAVRVAVLDPDGENAVGGMPRQVLGEADGGVRGTLSARELEILLLAARGLSNRQNSLLAEPRRGHHQAPPRQHLREAGCGLARRGREESPHGGLDHRR